MDRRAFVGDLTKIIGGFSLLGLPRIALAQPPGASQQVAPGEHAVMPLPFKADSLDGISEQVVNWHHGRHYAGYVKTRNEIEKQLAAMDPKKEGFDAKVFAGLKRQETFNACGQVLHENYFTILGGNGQPDAGSAVVAALTRDFGSVEGWQANLQATATAAGIGWGITAFDAGSGRLANYLVELHQNGAVWGTVPIVALDGWEHAFYHDYGPDKPKYFEAFFRNLHWGRIDEIYRRATA